MIMEDKEGQGRIGEDDDRGKSAKKEI